MNVLVIPAWYPRGKDKLMGIYHKEFCQALGNIKNIKVDMLFVDRQRIKAPIKYLFMKKKEIIKEKNYNVYITKMLDLDKISRTLSTKNYVKKLEKIYLDYIKTNNKPDIIHAEEIFPSGYAACVLGKKYHIPVVVTEHATYFERFFKGEYKEYGNFVLNNAYITTVSKFMLDKIPLSNDKKSVLPNLVDTEIFKKKRNKIKGLRIVRATALREGKRIDDLFKAVKILIDNNIKDVHITIIGDGFLEKYYKDKCHELGMDDYVDFIGRKTKEEIAEILNKNNMTVITSDMETFCIPVIEALASGMPVVSTKCLGPEEYLDEKCGKLVEFGNIEKLAQAIKEVYDNIDNYDINYLRSVADRYSSKNITDMALKIYKEILSKK